VRVIPVIDLMGGQVVRGVGGRRDEYRPIQSILCTDSRPTSVGGTLAAANFREVYVADLDAIGGGAPAWKIYAELSACGLDLWVDAGTCDAARMCELARFAAEGRQLTGLIAGLESLGTPKALADMVTVAGERLVFSLDLKHGQPLVQSGAWNGLSAEQIATIALRLGARRMIVLDLASVGEGRGVGTEQVCRNLRCRDAQLEITAGGGVRGWDDLRSLAAAGCDAALVASALHDGRISARECAAMR
jgi:phosphoribosylformimino-5-aminoimidazole carboxamide ribotide isomerase